MLYVILVVHGVWCGGAHLLAVCVRPLLGLLTHTVRVTSFFPFSMINLSIPLPLLLCTWGLFIPRIRRHTVLIVSLLFCLIGATTLTKRMIIKVSGSTVLLECPDRRTILFSPDPVDRVQLARISNVPERPWVDYVISPAVEQNLTGQWIPSPDPFTILRMNYGDIEITIDSTFRVCYGKQEFFWSKLDTPVDGRCDVHYVVSNEGKSIHIDGLMHGSIFDDLVMELRLINAQCALLVSSIYSKFPTVFSTKSRISQDLTSIFMAV